MLPTPTEEAVARRPAYVFLVLVIGLHLVLGSLLQAANPAFGIAFGEIFFFAGLSLLFTRAQNFRLVEFLALRPPPARTMVASIFVALVGFFFAGALNGINRWIVGEEIASRYDVTHIFVFRSPLEGALLVLGVAVLAPIGEELAFRGYLQRVLTARHGAIRAALLTGALFAVIHFNPASVLALFGLGVIFGLMRVWTGSIWPPVLAHAIQNGTSTALVLTGAAEASPDELHIGGALLLLLLTTPVLWFTLQHLRMGTPVQQGLLAQDPDASHGFSLARARGLLLALVAGALASLALLAVVDGEQAGARLRRALGSDVEPVPPPTMETTPEPGMHQ